MKGQVKIPFINTHREYVMRSILSLSVLAILSSHIYAQEDTRIGCYVDGECVNSVSVGFFTSNGTTSCYDFCQDTTGCNYFTNHPSIDLCFAFLDCVNFSNEECTDCTSGEAICPVLKCDLNSECIGTILGFEILNSVGQCAQLCLGTDNCGWWTFDSSDGVCALFQDCLTTTECTSCTSGQRKCYDGDYQGPCKLLLPLQ